MQELTAAKHVPLSHRRARVTKSNKEHEAEHHEPSLDPSTEQPTSSAGEPERASPDWDIPENAEKDFYACKLQAQENRRTH